MDGSELGSTTRVAANQRFAPSICALRRCNSETWRAPDIVFMTTGEEGAQRHQKHRRCSTDTEKDERERHPGRDRDRSENLNERIERSRRWLWIRPTSIPTLMPTTEATMKPAEDPLRARDDRGQPRARIAVAGAQAEYPDGGRLHHGYGCWDKASAPAENAREQLPQDKDQCRGRQPAPDPHPLEISHMSSVLTDLPGRKVMQAQGGATHRKVQNT